jgi:hypothetical protein
MTRGPGLTDRQRAAIRAAPQAAKALLQAQFQAQMKGPRGGGGWPTRPAARRGRVGGTGPQAIARMPGSRPHGADAFAGQSNRQLMQEAWKASPASSNIMAPRGLGYYDAFQANPMSAATHMSIGPCTPIDAKTTVGFTDPSSSTPSEGIIDTGFSKEAQLVIVQPAPDGVQAVRYNVSNATPTDLMNTYSYRSPQLEADPPTEMIPTRCSLRIRNYTAKVNKGGLIKVLRMTTGVFLDPDFTTNAQLLEIMGGIRDHKRTREYDGAELPGVMQKNCIVADQSRALTFQNFGEATPSDQYHPLPPQPPTTPVVNVYQFTKTLNDPAFTPIAILFEPFLNVQQGGGTSQSLGNTYQITVQSQFLAHYKQGTMLANLAFSPACDAPHINKNRDHEENKGSALEKVVHAVEAGGRFAWDHRYQLMWGAERLAHHLLPK